jgi:hypothetical protein
MPFNKAHLSLYAAILRGHRALPAQFRALGDAYVRDEFRRHRKAKDSFLGPFAAEWQRYLADLHRNSVGKDLPSEHAAALNEEQKAQLAKLRDQAFADPKAAAAASAGAAAR